MVSTYNVCRSGQSIIFNMLLLVMSILVTWKWTGGYIDLAVSREYSRQLFFAATSSEKEWTKKFSFIATNNWIVLAVQRSVNCSFALIMSILQKGLTEEEETSNSKMFFSTNKCHKGKSSFVMMDGYFQGWNLNISDIYLQPSNFMDELPCSLIDKNFFFVIYHEGN